MPLPPFLKEKVRAARKQWEVYRLGYNPSVSVSHRWYGNDHAGFFLCAKTLGPGAIVYSIGTGTDASFDLELIAEQGCKVFAFDPTPKSIRWVADSKLPASFIFTPLGIGPRNETATFYLPKNDDYVSGSMIGNDFVDQGKQVEVELRTLATLAKIHGHDKIDVLKMDIEGAEYEVLPDVLKSGIKIEQILVEFHHRMVEDGYAKTRAAIQLLRDFGYAPFAWSDRLEEISFISQ